MQTGPIVQNSPHNVPKSAQTNQENSQQQETTSWMGKLFNNAWVKKITALIPVAFSSAVVGAVVALVLLLELNLGHFFIEPFLSNVSVLTGLGWTFGGFGLVSTVCLGICYYNGYATGKDIFSFLQGFAFAAIVHLAFFLPLQFAYTLYFALATTAIVSGAWIFLYEGYLVLTKSSENGTKTQPSDEESTNNVPVVPESNKPILAPSPKTFTPQHDKNKEVRENAPNEKDIHQANEKDNSKEKDSHQLDNEKESDQPVQNAKLSHQN